MSAVKGVHCYSSFFPPKEPGPSLPFRQGVLSSIRMEAACNTQNLVKLIFVNEIQLLQTNNHPFKVTFYNRRVLSTICFFCMALGFYRFSWFVLSFKCFYLLAHRKVEY